MQDHKLGDTYVVKGDKFSLSQCLKNNLEVKEMQKIPCALTIGNLMYTQVRIHLDLAYIIGMLGRYLCNLKMDYWKIAKMVMRYL